jgi:hypothetical protein
MSTISNIATIVERVNEAVGFDTTFNDEQVKNLIWALAMDRETHNLFDSTVNTTRLEQEQEFRKSHPE